MPLRITDFVALTCTLPAGSDANYLTFIALRSTSNVVRKSLPPADDSISGDIDIPAGFAFGNTTLAKVYVSVKK